MSTAPYEVNVSRTDDETFVFALLFEQDDGTDFPFSDYAIEYSVKRNGCLVLSLTQDNGGIAISAGQVTFQVPAGSLCVGDYEHGCRIRLRETGDTFQVFDGAVTIGEGNFR